MIQIFAVIALTSFISVNGQVMEVAEDSALKAAYEENAVTDIGNPDNLDTTLSMEDLENSVDDGLLEDSVSDNNAVTYVVQPDNAEVVSLLEESVSLLAENSSSVTGSLNSSVLDLMDRMVDSYPSYYKYAGFRTNADDAYTATLYLAKKASVSGSTITFSEDCVAVDFRRYYNNYNNSYIYYTVIPSPNASVNVNGNSIVYTNVLKGYPSLGDKAKFPQEYVWIAVFVVLAVVIFVRRNRSD